MSLKCPSWNTLRTECGESFSDDDPAYGKQYVTDDSAGDATIGRGRLNRWQMPGPRTNVPANWLSSTVKERSHLY